MIASRPQHIFIEPQYKTWPANAAKPEHTVDPGGRPWVPSPGAHLFPLPPTRKSRRPVIPKLPSDMNEKTSAGAKKKGKGREGDQDERDDPFDRPSSGSWRLSFIIPRWPRRGRNDDEIRKEAEHWPALNDGKYIVQPAQWRAYGYWARPAIGNVIVRNATPPVVPRELSHREIESLMRRVSSNKEPLKWISRLEHPALPPRPELWDTPPLIPRQLPPSSLQLNPFLQHRPFGRPPVLFDMRLFTADILLGELPREEGDERPLRADFEEWGPDGSQPATWPGVPSLYISALADDAFPKFPWPVLVIPHHPSLPVLVRHVFNALIANFEERVKEEEMEALSEERRALVTRAYYTRLETRVGGRLPGEEDGVRRIDYLGDQVYFRGLEPAPDGDGFMMFVGSA